MAVQQGTVDGVYSTSPGGAMTVKLAEIAKYYTRVAVTGTAVEHGIVMNIESYNSLPADLQQLMNETAKAYGERILNDTKAAGDDSWDVLRDAGAQVYVVPEDEVDDWRAVWAPVRDKVLKEVLDQEEIDKMLAMIEQAR
jgi:TRAP-type C4-dicarboxylate transport system substrate-binding protein